MRCLKCAALTAELEHERRINEALMGRLTLGELEAILIKIMTETADQ